VATLLYRLGPFSFRNAWKVIGVWVLLLAARGVDSLSWVVVKRRRAPGLGVLPSLARPA
jgi:uncharacterized membrane protein YdfJ with MMPL/SSD domain